MAAFENLSRTASRTRTLHMAIHSLHTLSVMENIYQGGCNTNNDQGQYVAVAARTQIIIASSRQHIMNTQITELKHETLNHIPLILYIFSIWHGPKVPAKRLAQPQAWHAGDTSATPEQGEACELARVTRLRQAMPLSASKHMEKT